MRKGEKCSTDAILAESTKTQATRAPLFSGPAVALHSTVTSLRIVNRDRLTTIRHTMSAAEDTMTVDRAFELYDLRVTVKGNPHARLLPLIISSAPTDGRPLLCSSKPGDYFELRGEVITLPTGQGEQT